MTFSIAGRCARTGMFGVAITTSSICVGARCPHARAGVGAVATQNVTDPSLGPLMLDLMEKGMSASEAVAKAIEGHEHAAYRQLTAVDNQGRSASFTGANILGTNAVVEREDSVAAGNLLKTTAVPVAMADGFAAHAGEHLAERLLRALEAGLAAGGEGGPVHSACLIVHDKLPFALVDLRCDWADDGPISELRSLWNAYRKEVDDYVNRAVNPGAAPSYGVVGDP